MILDAADRSDRFVTRDLGDDAGRQSPAPTVTQFHIHVNCFSERPPISLTARSAGRRLNVAHYTSFVDVEPRSLWILTAKSARAGDADALYRRLLSQLADDTGMRGYVECEAVNVEDIYRYPPSEYRADRLFPDLGLRLAPGRRVADIHIFRDLAANGDALDAALTNSGFYKVTSEREHIWTLLAGDLAAARRIFTILHQLFGVAGGVSKLELEVVRDLTPIPAEFQMGRVAFDLKELPGQSPGRDRKFPSAR